MNCLNFRNFVATHQLQTGRHLFIMFTVTLFWWTQSIMLGLGFILVAFITITLASSCKGKQVQIRSREFYLPYSPEKLSKFGMKMLALCSAKSLWNFYVSLFCSIIMWYYVLLFKVWLRRSQNGYIFFFFYSQVVCNCSN